jgi:hypothetical protein
MISVLPCLAGKGRHKIDCDGSFNRNAVPPDLARLTQLKVTFISSCMDIAFVPNHTSSLKSQADEPGRYIAQAGTTLISSMTQR